MGKRIIISEEEKKHILGKYHLNEDFKRNDNGQIVVGRNIYNLFVDGTQRYYGGRDGEKYKICTGADTDGWKTFCKSVDISPENVTKFDSEMAKGVSPITHNADGKTIEFRKT